MELQDILVRIENTNQDDDYDDLRCRLKDCANEIIALRAKLAQPPKTVKEALEQAAKICGDISGRHHALVAQDKRYHYFACGCDFCADAIRALIQTEKGE